MHKYVEERPLVGSLMQPNKWVAFLDGTKTWLHVQSSLSVTTGDAAFTTHGYAHRLALPRLMAEDAQFAYLSTDYAFAFYKVETVN